MERCRNGTKAHIASTVYREVKPLSATIRVKAQPKVDVVDLDDIPVDIKVRLTPRPLWEFHAELNVPYLLQHTTHTTHTQPEVIKRTDEEWMDYKKRLGEAVVQNMASGVEITFLDVKTKKTETWSRQRYSKAVSTPVTIEDLAEIGTAYVRHHPYQPVSDNCQTFVDVIDSTLDITPSRMDPLHQATTSGLTFFVKHALEGPEDASLTSHHSFTSSGRYSRKFIDIPSFPATLQTSTLGSLLNTDSVHEDGTRENQDASQHHFPSVPRKHTEEIPPAVSCADEGPDRKYGCPYAFEDGARGSAERANFRSAPRAQGFFNKRADLNVLIPVGGTVASAVGTVFGSGSTLAVSVGMTASGSPSVGLVIGVANPLVGAGILGGTMLLSAGIFAYEIYKDVRGETAQNEEQR